MVKELLLRRIANTIVSNLNGSDNVSLFYGKMGTCLFLYAYERYIGKVEYREWAKRLLDDVFIANKREMMASIAEGYGGIGVGLCWLIQNQFLSTDAELFLSTMDQILLKEAQNSLRSDHLYSAPYYSSAVYLEWRKMLTEYPICESTVKEIDYNLLDMGGGNNFLNGLNNTSDILWWNFVLQKPFTRLSTNDVAKIVDCIQRDFVYEMETASGQMAILGLYLLQTTNTLLI